MDTKVQILLFHLLQSLEYSLGYQVHRRRLREQQIEGPGDARTDPRIGQAELPAVHEVDAGGAGNISNLPQPNISTFFIPRFYKRLITSSTSLDCSTDSF